MRWEVQEGVSHAPHPQGRGGGGSEWGECREDAENREASQRSDAGWERASQAGAGVGEAEGGREGGRKPRQPRLMFL